MLLPRPPVGVGKAVETVSCDAGKADEHRFAGGGSELVFRGVPHDGGAIGICEYEARIIRHDLLGHVIGDRKEQPVTMKPVVGPFLVDPEIFDARFDLDDPHHPVLRECDEIGPSARGEGHFGHGDEAETGQKPSRAPLNEQGRLGLSPVGRQNQGRIGHHGDFTGKFRNGPHILIASDGCIASAFLLMNRLRSPGR